MEKVATFIILLFMSLCRMLLATRECSLYIAPSSRSDEKKESNHNLILGVYAGVDYNPGDMIGPYEIAIPIIDIQFHNAHRSMESGEENATEESDATSPNDFFNAVADVLIAPENTGAELEIYPEPENEQSSVVVSIPGIGLLAKDSPFIINADFNQAWILNRTLTAHDIEQAEVSHPGRGAYTNYAPMVIEAKMYIPTGSEIFINFGDTEDKKAIDYQEVDQTLHAIESFFSKYEGQLTPSQQQTLYSFFLQDVLPYSGNTTRENQTDTLQAFPTQVDEVSSILKNGGSYTYHQPESFKTSSWLEEHGQCIDGLYSGTSSIPYAGRGAFATRAVGAGSVITAIPLLKIDDKSWLDMYETDVAYNEKGNPSLIRKDVEYPIVTKKQLLLNYCYGHPESSILFHPVGGTAVSLINHPHDGQEANAKIVWSDYSYYNRDWLQKSLQELKDLSGFYIGFDLIATRDIQADEEVLIDYGPEWEAAWKEHVESWQTYDDVWPLKAVDFNIEHKDSPFYTTFEREELVASSEPDPYPENIETICQLVWNEETQPSENQTYLFLSNVTYEELWTTVNLYRCDVTHRDVVEGGDIDDVNDYYYTVTVYPGGGMIDHVPHNCIRFHDKAYTSDMHASGTFRHPIGIPDSIFPELWRDLPLSDESSTY